MIKNFLEAPTPCEPTAQMSDSQKQLPAPSHLLLPNGDRQELAQKLL